MTYEPEPRKPDPLAPYHWRHLTEAQRATAEQLIAENLAAPLPTGEQRCRVRLDLKRRKRDGLGDRWYIDRDGRAEPGYVLPRWSA